MVTLPGPSLNPSPSLPKYKLAGLKPSFDTAWPCNMGSDCSRTAKAREGAERDTLSWSVHLGLGAAFIPWRMPRVHCRCAWQCTLFVLPALLILAAYLPHHYRLAWIALDSHSTQSLLSDLFAHLAVGPAPCWGALAWLPCCHLWLPAPLTLWSSPLFLPLLKQSGSLETF